MNVWDVKESYQTPASYSGGPGLKYSFWIYFETPKPSACCTVPILLSNMKFGYWFIWELLYISFVKCLPLSSDEMEVLCVPESRSCDTITVNMIIVLNQSRDSLVSRLTTGTSSRAWSCLVATSKYRDWECVELCLCTHYISSWYVSQYFPSWWHSEV